jgi:hypothetical protein
MVRQMVGRHWSEEGTTEKVPVNMIADYVRIVSRSLVANNPRVILSTFRHDAKPIVHAMSQYANDEMERMCLSNVLVRGVIDALFSIGITKVALAKPSEAALYSWQLRAGDPFAERIDLDDFVFDPHARAFEEVSFIGHRCRVPLDTIRDDPMYSSERKNLSPMDDQPFNLEGDERVSMLGRGYIAGIQQEYEDMVDLWEIYIPRHRKVITLADYYLSGPDASKEPLLEQPWIGPVKGPIHILGYGWVPGNPMPKAPIQDLYDLHIAGNQTFRKILRQVERIKEILAVAGGAMEDGSRVMTANDGDIIRVDNPERLQQLVMGGNALQQVLAVFTVIKDLFNRQGGNLELLGGQGPQSKTARQDELLNQNAGSGMAEMVDETTKYTASIVRALCWYWHHHPKQVQTTQHVLQGAPGLSITRHVTPEQRKGIPFDSLGLKVDPYSMRYQSPESRLAAINEVVMQVVMPMMQLLQQQGISFDMNAYLHKVGKYKDLPDLADLLTIREPPQPKQGGDGGGDQPGMPGETTRNYVRENRSEGTRQGQDRNLVNTLLGGNPGGASNGKAVGAGL